MGIILRRPKGPGVRLRTATSEALARQRPSRARFTWCGQPLFDAVQYLLRHGPPESGQPSQGSPIGLFGRFRPHSFGVQWTPARRSCRRPERAEAHGVLRTCIKNYLCPSVRPEFTTW